MPPAGLATAGGLFYLNANFGRLHIHDMGDITGEVTTNEKLSYIWNGKTNRSEAIFAIRLLQISAKALLFRCYPTAPN